MKWPAIAALVIASLASLYWFAGVIRKADRAAIANQTIEEVQKRDEDSASISKLDMAGICDELDLDLLPDGSGCE